MTDAILGEITDSKAMKAHFASGNLARAYLFFGEEEYLKDLYIARIKKLAVDDPMNIYLFTGKTDLAEIAEIVNGVSLFEKKSPINAYTFCADCVSNTFSNVLFSWAVYNIGLDAKIAKLTRFIPQNVVNFLVKTALKIRVNKK